MVRRNSGPSNAEQVFGTAEILRVIMKYCDQDEKKSLHCINKKIYEDSMEYWRESMVARIGWCNCFGVNPANDGDYKQAKDGICRRKTHILTGYPALITQDPPLLNLRTLPYQNLILANWNFRVAEADQTVTFWPFITPQVRNLEVDGCSISRNSLWADDFFQKFPNLESFTLKDIHFPSERWHPEERPHTYVCENLRSLKLSHTPLMQSELVNLFRHCYRIQEFTVDRQPLLYQRRNFGTVRVLRDNLEAIAQARNLPEIIAVNGLNIRNLDFMDVHDRALRCCSYYRHLFKYQQFVTARLPLQYIALDIPVRATALAGCNVMSAHQDTLRVAVLFRCPTDEPIWTFAHGLNMNQMRTLVLWGAVTSNFGFLKSMPNLTYLKIQRSCYDVKYKVEKVLTDRYYLNFNSCYVENTKKVWVRSGDTREDGTPVGAKLQYLEVDFEFKKKSVKAISRWMPNLKEIKFIVNEDTLKVIAKKWKNLEALTMLHGSTMYNESVNDLAKLKKLHSFTLQTKCGESMLSDQCVRNGFLQMENLKTLDICVSPHMSPHCAGLLEERFKNLKIRRNYGPHKDFCCALGEFERSINLPTKTETMSLRSRNVDFPSRA